MFFFILSYYSIYRYASFFSLHLLEGYSRLFSSLGGQIMCWLSNIPRYSTILKTSKELPNDNRC